MVKDYKLQRYFKRLIENNMGDFTLFKSLYYCGSKTIKDKFGTDYGVSLLANKEHAIYWGTTTCKNSWACPVCSAKQMSIYAADIACAIDALKKWHNQVAFMVTLTIPHTSGMTCEETTEILYKTWSDFTIHGNKAVRNYKNDPFANFCQENNCTHRVRVGEFTYGNAGWHPHFHCLFWVDKDKLQNVKNWRDQLNERWMSLAKKNTLKRWNLMFANKVNDNKKRLEIMYQNLNKISRGLYISVDDNDKVIEQKSSDYICGWGANKEVTGNYQKKASHEGHLTPYQILEKAAEIGTMNNEYAELYMEYTRAVRKYSHARINFSVRSGIRKIIADWKKTNDYISTLKKKCIERQKTEGSFKLVCWLSSKQWSKICQIDKEVPIKAGLLECALLPNGRQIIIDTLSLWDIEVTESPPDFATTIALKMYNNVA